MAQLTAGLRPGEMDTVTAPHTLLEAGALHSRRSRLQVRCTA